MSLLRQVTNSDELYRRDSLPPKNSATKFENFMNDLLLDNTQNSFG